MLSRSDLFAILQHRFQPIKKRSRHIIQTQSRIEYHAELHMPYGQILMFAHKITPMHSCTYKMQPLYYIAPNTEFLIAEKPNQCYGGNAKPIALPSEA